MAPHAKHEVRMGLLFAILVVSNLVAVAAGIAWAYLAYRHSQQHVTGATGTYIELFIGDTSPAFGIALCSWVAGPTLMLAADFRRRSPLGFRISAVLVTLACAPLAVLLTHWLLHLRT
ncbi:MAG TPA: hypothetical protein VFT37_02225 [Telluria sp.]|nr:hypothetical protein [Telluria sp.]